MITPGNVPFVLSSLIYCFLVCHTKGQLSRSETRPTRTYYIGATEVDWDYAPEGNLLGPGADEYLDLYLGKRNDPLKIGQVYRKAVLREFTDDTFTVQKPREPWLGILGPIVKGEVGDVLHIIFKNMATHPISIHPHGVRYEKIHEGALYDDNTTETEKNDDRVPPGGRYFYRWLLNSHDAPTEDDPDCLTWTYHSHRSGETELHAGLLGPLLVCKPGSLRSSKIDRRIVLVFMNFDENKSVYIDENIERHATRSMTAEEREAIKEDAEFKASNQMHTINGFAFGNLKGLDMCVGDRLTWHLVGMGDVVDVHTASFEGHVVNWNGHKTDDISLFPAKFATAFMVARRPGTWPIRCEVGSHAHLQLININQIFSRTRQINQISVSYIWESNSAVRVSGASCSHWYPNTGHWVCKPNDHGYEDLAITCNLMGTGMEAFFRIHQCNNRQRPAEINHLNGKLREYFIAAEEVEWNYAPSGFNFLSGKNLTDDTDSAVYFRRGPHSIGGVYRKAIYREYTDATFTRQKARDLEEIHLAILGPTIRGEVGDVIKITFRNKASWPYSIHSHGAYYLNSDGVKTNETQVTYWSLLDQYGPSELDPDCLPWRYFSDEDFRRDAYDALNGILLVCRPGTLDNEGKQKNIDREFSLVFSAIDENESHYIDDSVLTYTSDPYGVDFYDSDFRLANRRYSINGRMYGNLEGLLMCKGEKIIWNILGVGRSIDLHTAYFHGNNFKHHGVYRDTITVVPSILYSISMTAENEGDWIVECRTNSHLKGGMRALYRVQECGKRQKRQVYENEITFGNRVSFNPSLTNKNRLNHIIPSVTYTSSQDVNLDGKVREYFIAAIEEEWEYAAKDRHLVHGGPLIDNEESRIFVERKDDRIGSRYKKALYREYTDSTFSTRKNRGPESIHLGVMGPMIKAEVGDMIRVTFRNMASRPYSIHPHGVLIHESDRRPYMGSDEDPVQPGDYVVYEWTVPVSAGPGEKGFNCTSWSYYSAVDPVKDTNAGLIGPLIVCRKGILTNTGARVDAQHEFAVLYTIFDENDSWYIDENIQRFCRNPSSVNKKDSKFRTSNRMHAVNGRIYGTLEGLVAKNGTKTAWYLLGMGSEDDLHTAHFHGQTFLQRTDTVRRGDVVDLFPGYFDTVEMINDNPGTWILHCHVDDHMRYGMAALFTVTP